MEKVISVQHSGTRTLKRLLGLVDHFHFRNERVLRNNELVHIPVRNPWDVAASWACRTQAGDTKSMVNAYDLMFRFLDGDCPRKLYRMEDYENLKGSGERNIPPDRVGEFQQVMKEHVLLPHVEFFRQFYSDKQLCLR